MSEVKVGKCSICGGTVTVPALYFGKPIPTCRSCGAVEDDRPRDTDPVIPMKKPGENMSVSFQEYMIKKGHING